MTRSADTRVSRQEPEDRNNANRFLVSYDFEYGYSFVREGDRDTIIAARFAADDVRRQFDEFFSNANLRQISEARKRIYCDCVGEFYERDGRGFYTVRSAHLFAE